MPTKRIGVSKLVSVLYGDMTNYVPEYYLKQGAYWHRKLGYFDNIHLSRYYEYEGEKWLLIGIPDLIEEDTVVELKVVFSRKKISHHKEKGETQANIYAWMGAFPYYRCDVYYVEENKLLPGKKKQTDTELAERNVREGIRLLKEFSKLMGRKNARKTS